MRERTISDQELLESELNYQPPRHDKRFFKTHPPGYNVMAGLGAFFALMGFLLGLVGTLSVLGRGGVGEIIGSIVGLVTAAILGWKLPRMIWRGIGPSGRAGLRIFGRLGAGGVLIPCFLISALLVVGLKGGLMTPTNSEVTPIATPTVERLDPLSGPEWQVLVDADNKPLSLTLAEAQVRCKALGEGWRLPRLSDQRFVMTHLTNPTWKSCIFHYDNGDYHGYFYFGESVNQWCPRAAMDDPPRQVLCLRTP